MGGRGWIYDCENCTLHIKWHTVMRDRLCLIFIKKNTRKCKKVNKWVNESDEIVIKNLKLITKKAEKEVKAQKVIDKFRTVNKMIYLNLIISIILLNMNDLNTQVNGRRSLVLKKKSTYFKQKNITIRLKIKVCKQIYLANINQKTYLWLYTKIISEQGRISDTERDSIK